MSKPAISKVTPYTKIADFGTKLEELAAMIAERALALKSMQQFDLQLDAMKVLTAFYAAKNRATEGDEDGAAIEEMRKALLEEPAPELENEALEGASDDVDSTTDP